MKTNDSSDVTDHEGKKGEGQNIVTDGDSKTTDSQNNSIMLSKSYTNGHGQGQGISDISDKQTVQASTNGVCDKQEQDGSGDITCADTDTGMSSTSHEQKESDETEISREVVYTYRDIDIDDENDKECVTDCGHSSSTESMDLDLSTPVITNSFSLASEADFVVVNDVDDPVVIKKEPAPEIEYSMMEFRDVESYLCEVTNGYQHCESHAKEMLEKNIVCLSCQSLICALCLRDNHHQHHIVSITKLRECKSVRSTLEEDVSVLQLLQKGLTEKFSEQQSLKKQIEMSAKSLLAKVDKAFEEMLKIIQEKKNEIRSHILDFERQNVQELSKELEKIKSIEKTATLMIKRVMIFFTEIDTREGHELPQKLKDVIMMCQSFSDQNSDQKERYLPERKFSKILPSLHAVTNICQTIHPEATKVVWSKIIPDKRNNEQEEAKDAGSKVCPAPATDRVTQTPIVHSSQPTRVVSPSVILQQPQREISTNNTNNEDISRNSNDRGISHSEQQKVKDTHHINYHKHVSSHQTHHHHRHHNRAKIRPSSKETELMQLGSKSDGKSDAKTNTGTRLDTKSCSKSESKSDKRKTLAGSSVAEDARKWFKRPNPTVPFTKSVSYSTLQTSSKTKQIVETSKGTTPNSLPSTELSPKPKEDNLLPSLKSGSNKQARKILLESSVAKVSSTTFPSSSTKGARSKLIPLASLSPGTTRKTYNSSCAADKSLFDIDFAFADALVSGRKKSTLDEKQKKNNQNTKGKSHSRVHSANVTTSTKNGLRKHLHKDTRSSSTSSEDSVKLSSSNRSSCSKSSTTKGKKTRARSKSPLNRSRSPISRTSRSLSNSSHNSLQLNVLSSTRQSRSKSPILTSSNKSQSVRAKSPLLNSRSPLSSTISPSKHCLSSSSGSKSQSTETKEADSSTDYKLDAQGLPILNLVNFNISQMTTGRAVIIQGPMEKTWMGRVANVSRLKDSNYFNVQWFSGKLGVDTQFEIQERWQRKVDNAHTDCVIGHFEYNCDGPMKPELLAELTIAAKQPPLSERKTTANSLKGSSSEETEGSPGKDSRSMNSSPARGRRKRIRLL